MKKSQLPWRIGTGNFHSDVNPVVIEGQLQSVGRYAITLCSKLEDDSLLLMVQVNQETTIDGASDTINC